MRHSRLWERWLLVVAVGMTAFGILMALAPVRAIPRGRRRRLLRRRAADLAFV